MLALPIDQQVLTISAALSPVESYIQITDRHVVNSRVNHVHVMRSEDTHAILSDLLYGGRPRNPRIIPPTILPTTR